MLNDTKNPCVILTGDKDSFQLISDNTTVKLATNKNDIVFTPESLYEKYELAPEQMTDLKALMGDSSDNIPDKRNRRKNGADADKRILYARQPIRPRGRMKGSVEKIK